jgi:alpha-D-ribose 1-methylphosphonate 5-triphosphate synthase subunit PhnG
MIMLAGELNDSTVTMRCAFLKKTSLEVSHTRVARLLGGYRDHPPAKLEAVFDALIAVSQMLAELTELDINPLLADDAGGRARRPCARERPARSSAPNSHA